MRVTVCLLAIAGLALAGAAEVEEEDDVLVVTGDNYKQILEENEFVLLEFCKFPQLWFPTRRNWLFSYSLSL